MIMRVVPLTQPERDNPLMRPYFLEIGLSALRLARRCGVSHSQIYMARKRNVGAGNAEKIARGTASTLGLSERERLELKAEIMGHPGDLVRAYLGSQADAMKILGVREHTASELVSEEKSVNHASGTRALRKLREIGAPRCRRGVGGQAPDASGARTGNPDPRPPRPRVGGAEAEKQGEIAGGEAEGLRGTTRHYRGPASRPKTSGKAPVWAERPFAKPSTAVWVLRAPGGDRYGPRKGRSEEEMRALEEELRGPPKRNCKKLGRWCLNPSDLGNT